MIGGGQLPCVRRLYNNQRAATVNGPYSEERCSQETGCIRLTSKVWNGVVVVGGPWTDQGGESAGELTDDHPDPEPMDVLARVTQDLASEQTRGGTDHHDHDHPECPSS